VKIERRSIATKRWTLGLHCDTQNMSYNRSATHGGDTGSKMNKLNTINHLVLMLLAGTCFCSMATAAASTAGHDHTAAATAANSELHVALPAGRQVFQTSRNLQQDVQPLAELQQALRRMLSVPIATPATVLELGYKGLKAHTLRNWRLLAQKLSRPGAYVTIVTFGGSLTAGYMKRQEDWRSSMEGSWVEQLVKWLKVRGIHLNLV
jgi:hypothetical protein